MNFTTEKRLIIAETNHYRPIRLQLEKLQINSHVFFFTNQFKSSPVVENVSISSLRPEEISPLFFRLPIYCCKRGSALSPNETPGRHTLHNFVLKWQTLLELTCWVDVYHAFIQHEVNFRCPLFTRAANLAMLLRFIWIIIIISLNSTKYRILSRYVSMSCIYRNLVRWKASPYFVFVVVLISTGKANYYISICRVSGCCLCVSSNKLYLSS